MSENGAFSRRDVPRTVAVVGVTAAVVPGVFTVLDTDARTTVVAAPGSGSTPSGPSRCPATRRPGTGATWARTASRHMAGEFTYVHTLDVDSRGDIYTAETIGGRRVQRFRVVGD
jgi:hypothetical protein